jgi:hypothetical protein
MLTVTITRCSNLRNVARVIRQDPFVCLSIPSTATTKPENAGVITKKTSVALAGGVNPTWLFKNKLRLKVERSNVDVTVQVWDKEVFQNNRLIGEGKLSLKDFEEDGCEEEPKDVDIYFDGKYAGCVHCVITYDPPTDDGSSLDLGLTEADLSEDGMASPTRKRLRSHYSQIRTVTDKIPSTVLYAGLTFFLLIFISSWFRYFVYFLLAYVLFYVALLTVIPLGVALGLPRFLGWSLTKIVALLTMNYPISFGTISIVPYMTDFKTLRFHFSATDFYMGNPPQAGFVSKKFLSLDRLDLDGSVEISDLVRLIKWDLERCPLKKVRDFKRLITVRIDRLEFSGFTLDFQLSTKNRLNINEMTKEFAMNELKQNLFIKRKIDPKQFKFPNLLEVQVVRARNLKAMDRNGLSDPYYVIKVRKEKRKSDTIMKCLNPMFPTKIEQFHVLDPAAVLHIQMWDEDFGKQSDFIGQWIITLKWLLMDYKHCRYVELEENCPGKDDGWVGMWVPLQDSNFRGEGTRGDVHIRLRWIYSPEFPLERPPISANKAIEQISENRIETRLRLGDSAQVIHMLNHIPVLFDFGLVIVRDAKVGVQDLLFGRQGGSSGSGGGNGQVPNTPRPRSVSASGTTATNHTLAPQSFSSPPATTATTTAAAASKPSPLFSFPRRLASSTIPSASRASSSRAALLKRESSDFSSSSPVLTGSAASPLTLFREASPGILPRLDGASNGGGDEPDETGEEEGEYEENGRKFAKIKLIEWHTQFAARHGDPGLPVFKVLDRFFRGLAPKLAANQKLHFRLLKHSFHSVNWDDVFSTDRVIAATKQAANIVASTAMGVAKVAHEQTKFVEKKYFSHHSSNGHGGRLRGESASSGRGLMADLQFPPPSRKASALDEDIIDGDLLIHGRLETKWETSSAATSTAKTASSSTSNAPMSSSKRRRSRALFGRSNKWKPWFVEIRGKTVFYKKGASSAQSNGAWYVLELIGLTGLYVTGNHDAAAGAGEEHLVLRFSTTSGAQALHLRLPTSTPSSPVQTANIALDEWVSVFTKLRQVQQAEHGFTPGLGVSNLDGSEQQDKDILRALSTSTLSPRPASTPGDDKGEGATPIITGRSASFGGEIEALRRAASSGGGAGGESPAKRSNTLPLSFSIEEDMDELLALSSSPGQSTTVSPETNVKKLSSPITKNFSSVSFRRKITSVFS